MDNYIEDCIRQSELIIEDYDFYDNNIIENSYNAIIKIRKLLIALRNYIIKYTFGTMEDEILFFKTQKPEILSKLLLFNGIYQIETRCPNLNDDVSINYLNKEMDDIKYYLEQNVDFYQYYRSNATLYDKYYFVRGNEDLKLNNDVLLFDRDPLFSTGYDYKIAQILSNEILRIYISKRLNDLSFCKISSNLKISNEKKIIKFTGNKISLIELGYALISSGDINQGKVDVKILMEYLGNVFDVDLKDYYRAYVAIKERKKGYTPYLKRLIESLEKKIENEL